MFDQQDLSRQDLSRRQHVTGFWDEQTADLDAVSTAPASGGTGAEGSQEASHAIEDRHQEPVHAAKSLCFHNSHAQVGFVLPLCCYEVFYCLTSGLPAILSLLLRFFLCHDKSLSDILLRHRVSRFHEGLNEIVLIGTAHQPCWLTEAHTILLLLFLCLMCLLLPFCLVLAEPGMRRHLPTHHLLHSVWSYLLNVSNFVLPTSQPSTGRQVLALQASTLMVSG